jgi:Domain of unknown function (DUF4136)
MHFDLPTRKRSICLLIAFTLLSLVSSAQSVKSDYDSNVDFNKFKTYAWLAPGDSVLNRYRSDKLYAGAINLAANKALTDIGLKQDAKNPDAIFMYYTGVEEITKYSQSPTLSVGVGVAGPGYYVAGSAPVAGGKITATTEEDGSMKFVMYDTQTKKMVWSGSANKTFKMSDDVEKIVMDYTAKIFKKYPIKKLGK